MVTYIDLFTGWVPVLKLAEHQSVAPASGIHNMWTGTYTINEYDPNARLYTAGSKTYKSSIVDKWSQYYISAVSLSRQKIHKYAQITKLPQNANITLKSTSTHLTWLYKTWVGECEVSYPETGIRRSPAF